MHLYLLPADQVIVDNSHAHRTMGWWLLIGRALETAIVYAGIETAQSA